ncbi:MAG: hypothetical protein Q7T03_08750 [Deltaproteobacteria bacterium]|nr:hypothetical protein [Deltaproteobacteria bacterium]
MSGDSFQIGIKVGALLLMGIIMFGNTNFVKGSNMDFKERAAAIADELENQPAWKKTGKFATDLAAIILAGIPVAGSASVVVDKIGNKLFEPAIQKNLVQLAKIVEGLAPDIEKIQTLEDQVGAMLVFLQENKSVLQRLDEIYNKLGIEEKKTFGVLTDNSLQEFVEVTVKDMNVRMEARNRGENILYRFRSSGGDVEFVSTAESQQRVYQSTFTGQHGGTVGMDGLGVAGPVQTFDHKNGTGVGFGSGGTLTFEQGSVITFGKKSDK